MQSFWDQCNVVIRPSCYFHPQMEVAHGSISGKSFRYWEDNWQDWSAFYWPAIQGDITRFCKWCDVCQKTVNKRSVPKVFLQKMPLIDKPFKRVAIDLVGPISPPSEERVQVHSDTCGFCDSLPWSRFFEDYWRWNRCRGVSKYLESIGSSWSDFTWPWYIVRLWLREGSNTIAEYQADHNHTLPSYG